MRLENDLLAQAGGDVDLSQNNLIEAEAVEELMKSDERVDEGAARVQALANHHRKENMKMTTKMLSLGLVLAAALAGATGCSKASKSEANAVQGTWKGQETNTTGTASLVLTGTNLEFHGANPQEWYKGTFTLREDTNPKQMIVVITDCPDSKYVGKTAYAIYQIQDGAMTITAHEPGDTNVPTTFDGPDVRKIVFKQ